MKSSSKLWKGYNSKLLYSFQRHLTSKKADRRVLTSLNNFEDFYSEIYGPRWLSLYSSLQQNTRHCAMINKYCHRSASIDFLEGLGYIKVVNIPTEIEHTEDKEQTLKCYLSETGQLFPQPKPGPNCVLGYYLLDMASLVPILNLDVQPEDSVLDMCASPGGKSLAVLQHLSGRGVLVANDALHSRRMRLKRVLKSYIPRRYQHFVYMKNLDGMKYGDYEPDTYNKVLVDVPCSADRHGVHDQFQSSTWSIKKSQKNSEIQKAFNIRVKTAAPNGTVVYSTCTLSPLENDQVVDYALQYCSENALDVEVAPCVDVSAYFSACEYSKVGTLIVPTKENNWGPMYVCKFIKRVNSKYVQFAWSLCRERGYLLILRGS